MCYILLASFQIQELDAHLLGHSINTEECASTLIFHSILLCINEDIYMCFLFFSGRLIRMSYVSLYCNLLVAQRHSQHSNAAGLYMYLRKILL